MDKAPTSDLGIAGSSPAKVVDFSSNCEECQRLRSGIYQKNEQIISIWLWAMCHLIEVTFLIH
jgi:hypothetical protein